MPSDSQMGWIWPKDPRPGNPEHWPTRWRIFDVLTNKGPDIYVGKLRARRHRTSPGSTRPTAHWSGWERGNSKPERRPFPWAQLDNRERYDYRTRRYQIPDGGTWSKVEYFDDGREARGNEVECIPRTFSDRDGHRFLAKEWPDGFYRGHEDPRLGGAMHQEDIWRHENTRKQEVAPRSHEHPKKQEVYPKVQEKKKTGFGWNIFGR